jgi:two-component system response regulator PilR (NtrC family)
MPSILLVDDEQDILEFLEQYLEDRGMEVSRTTSARDALNLIKKKEFDLVISDIRMPEMSGVELLKEGKKLAPETVFILITAHASTDTAIDAQQHGAFGYLTKPFKNKDEVGVLVTRALETRNNRPDIPLPRKESDARQSQILFQALHRNRIVGKSPKMLDVCRTIGTVATTDSTVLITGESGTGKELVARAIHEASFRREGPFVSINCGAFPETLLESELFGYLKGAFTGAGANKKGLFEAAAGGSIFLDEIGDMTPPMQVKLLRVLQERRLRPLGGTTEVTINVRVIAATNRDLKAAIQEGQFRDDLYYRVAVIVIKLPSLRERAEDIDLLTLHFLRQYSERAGKNIYGISEEVRRCLERYSWPGNIRELENTIERAVALETSEAIQIEQLPETIRIPQPDIAILTKDAPDEPFDLDAYVADVERSLICKALEKCAGNQTLAAEYLRLTKPSLRHKILTLGIDPASFKRNHSAS